MAGDTFTIRPASAGDAEAIAGLVVELAAALGLPSAVHAGTVREHLAAAGTGILLATRNGAAVGMLSYSIRPNLYHAALTCMVEELSVTEKARGAGIGAALLDAVVELARQAGCAEVSLSVMPDNTDAIRFYRRHGFTDEALLLERHFDDINVL